MLRLKADFTLTGGTKLIAPCSLVVERRSGMIERLAGLHVDGDDILASYSREGTPVWGLERGLLHRWYTVPLYWRVPIDFGSALLYGSTSYISVQGHTKMTLKALDSWDVFNDIYKDAKLRRKTDVKPVLAS